MRGVRITILEEEGDSEALGVNGLRLKVYLAAGDDGLWIWEGFP